MPKKRREEVIHDMSAPDFMGGVLDVLRQQFNGAGVTLIVSRPPVEQDASVSMIVSSVPEYALAEIMREYVRNYDTTGGTRPPDCKMN